MKRLAFLLCAVFLLSGVAWMSAFGAPGDEQEGGVLRVAISGMKNEKGDVKVALFNSKESFEGSGPAFRSARAEIKHGRSGCDFSGIPFGIYALKVYHDENGNGKLDKNAMGQPRERYGFSNNARNTFGPAGFDQAKFLFEKTEMTISIPLE